MNCEFAGYADHILKEKGVTCTPAYWGERDDWTLAMVAASLGFAFMPTNTVTHAGVVALPVVEPEFWRRVDLVTVRGRPYSPGVGALVREAMQKKCSGIQHFMDHLMPPLEGMMKALGTPNITPELKQKVISGVMREAAGRTVDQLAQEENRVLIGLLKLREETGLNKLNGNLPTPEIRLPSATLSW
jgi:hypothetical protein